MSTMTAPPAAGDFGDWDDFLEFAAITRDYDLAELTPEGPVRESRPHRSTADAKAIAESERDFS